MIRDIHRRARGKEALKVIPQMNREEGNSP